jgi:tetratricopeptide (TPR) repeat protein
MGTAYRYLGLANLAEGEYRLAESHFLKSLEIFGKDFVGWDVARSLTYLGDARFLAGDLQSARDNYRDALRLSYEIEALPIALDALTGLSHLQAQAGKAEPALVLCSYILNHPSTEEGTKSRVRRLCRDMEDQFDQKELEALRLQAQAKTYEMIVNEALAGIS